MSLAPDEPDDMLDALAEHCLAARALIGEHGPPTMRSLIDLLLFEIGVAIASRVEQEPVERDGSG